MAASARQTVKWGCVLRGSLCTLDVSIIVARTTRNNGSHGILRHLQSNQSSAGVFEKIRGALVLQAGVLGRGSSNRFKKAPLVDGNIGRS